MDSINQIYNIFIKNKDQLKFKLIHLLENIIKSKTYNSQNQIIDDIMFHFKEKILDDLKIENGKSGYLYCLWNEVYKYYGDNVYKLGMTNNLKKRTMGYTTSYIQPSQIIYSTKKVHNYRLAEGLLFIFLKNYRIDAKREFFNCSIDIIKSNFDKIEIIFDNNNKNDIIKKWMQKVVNNKIKTIRAELISYFKDKNINNFLVSHNLIFITQNDKNKLNFTIKNLSDKNLNFIKTTFGLNKLTNEFLNDIKNMENITTFNKSLIYLADDEYKKTETNDKIKYNLNKGNLVKQILNLFWVNNLLDTKTIKVFSGISLTDKQNQFISKNEKELRSLFNGLKRKIKPKNTFQLFGWINVILKEFFGGFVSLDISNQKSSRKGKNKVYYYYISINCYKYLELILCKNYKILSINNLNIIKNTFGETNCQYNNLHNQNIFLNMIK